MSDTLIDLIRHGAPQGGRRYRGCGIDDPLSAEGWAQMRRALGDAAPWDQLISSPLARCRDFATELAARHGLPLAIEPQLAERHMGRWEGRPHTEVAASEPEAHAAYRRDPLHADPHGAEPLAAFMARIQTAYRRQLAAYPGRHLLILCHAGVSRAILIGALDLDPALWHRLRIDYAGISRLRHGPEGARLDCLNAPILPETARSL